MSSKTTAGWARNGAALAISLLAVSALAACGGDATAAPTTTQAAETLAQYGVRVDTECPGDDPGFDSFLAEHPDPTAADWAGFLPAPLKMVGDVRDCIAASNPPAEVADKIDAVVAAFDVVVVDFKNALTAAQADDLETTEKWVSQMHDIDQPKIEEAIAEVGFD